MGIQKGTQKKNNPDYEEKKNTNGKTYYKKKEQVSPATHLDNSTISSFDDFDDRINDTDPDEIYDSVQEDIEDLLGDHIDKGKDYFSVDFDGERSSLSDFSASYADEVAYNDDRNVYDMPFTVTIDYGSTDETINNANSKSMEKSLDLPEGSTIIHSRTEINIPCKNIDDLKNNMDSVKEAMDLAVMVKEDYPVVNDSDYQEAVDDYNAQYIADNWYYDVESFKTDTLDEYREDLEDEGVEEGEIERLSTQKEEELDNKLAIEKIQQEVINNPYQYGEGNIDDIDPQEVISGVYNR